VPDVETMVEAGVRRRMEALREVDARFAEIQREKLLAVVRRNADTEFGRAHRFDRIHSVEDYRREVPVSTAPDYARAWERIHRGDRGVLFADPVHAYALSSGTTGSPKRVPLTQALVRGLKRVVGHTTACFMARTRNFSLLRGYALQLAAAPEVARAPDGAPVGYVTGIMSAMRAYPFHNIGVPSAEVLNLPDWAEKYRLIAERHADWDVRMLFGVPSYVLAFLRDLLRGRGLPDTRALWPNLALVLTSGVALQGYRDRIEPLCPGAELLEMYLATEGPFAFQEAPDAPLTPMAEDVFFEFVPRDRWGEARPPRVALDEVEPGVPYALLVTTPAGLYAYAPGDVVVFESARPPRLRVAGRLHGTLNLATEKVDGAQAERALREAGIEFEEFSVCPAGGGADAHEWVIEPRGAAPPDAARRLDAALAALNPSYGAVRSGDRVLGPPTLTFVRPGTFAAALRRRPGQGKILRVYADRAVRDELVALSESPA
jgi:hypothetical protein